MSANIQVKLMPAFGWTSSKAAQHRGYSDAAAGQPWNEEFYSKLSPRNQLSYEIGRLYAVQLLAVGITPPEWTYGKKMGDKVISAIVQSSEIAGGPIPGYGYPPDKPFTPHKPKFIRRPITLEELGL